jgi:hypothetical protein|nr:hypothetical protein Q903MT_gene4424 [Picea sitchensis]
MEDSLLNLNEGKENNSYLNVRMLGKENNSYVRSVAGTSPSVAGNRCSLFGRNTKEEQLSVLL